MTTVYDGRTGEPLAEPTTRRTRPTAAHDDWLDDTNDPELRHAVNTPRPFRPQPLAHFTVDALLERGSHYAVVDSVSPKCAQAWAEVVKAYEGARDALDRRDALDFEAQDAKRAASQAVQDAVAAGRAVKPVEIPDFTARREALEIEARARFDHARALRDKYKATYDAELAPALERLVAEIEPARAAARDAWQAAEAPLTRLHNVLTVAGLVQHQLDPEDMSHRTSPEAQGLARSAPGALATLGAWLTSSDPVVSGSRFTSASEIRPPLHAREALWNSDKHSDAALLAEIEALVDSPPYSVTSYTRREFEHHFRKVE